MTILIIRCKVLNINVFLFLLLMLEPTPMNALFAHISVKSPSPDFFGKPTYVIHFALWRPFSPPIVFPRRIGTCSEHCAFRLDRSGEGKAFLAHGCHVENFTLFDAPMLVVSTAAAAPDDTVFADKGNFRRKDGEKVSMLSRYRHNVSTTPINAFPPGSNTGF